MAMAQPMTSWMSLPIIAISAITQSAYRGTAGYSALQRDDDDTHDLIPHAKDPAR